MAFPWIAVARILKRAKVKRLITPQKIGLPKIPRGKLSTLVRKGITNVMSKELSSQGHVLNTAARLMQQDPTLTAQDIFNLERRAEASMQAAAQLEQGYAGRAADWAPAIEMTTEQNYIGMQGGKFAFPTEIEFWDPDTGTRKKLDHTFITVDMPDIAEFYELVIDFIDTVGSYPEFKDAYADGRYEFDYNILGVEQTT